MSYGKLLKNGEFVQGEVAEVNDTHVRLASGREIKYDYVVIASGSFYSGLIKCTSAGQRAEELPRVEELRERG